MSKKDKPEKNFSLKLRDIRKEKGLTLGSLADKTGIDYQKIARAERGEVSPTIDMLSQLAEVMQVPIKDLVYAATMPSEDNNHRTKVTNSDERLAEKIPLIYELLDELCKKNNLTASTSVKVQIATMMYKVVQDIRLNVQDDVNMVRALFQAFDTILERLVLSHNSYV